jgi:response regulator RpfG family c-di-GMP phosphodiesterase
VPIIALTAFAMNEDEDRCREAGMNDYIAKPFSPAQLLQKIIYYTLRQQVRAGRIEQEPEQATLAGSNTFDKDYLSNIDLTNLEEFVRGNEKLKRVLMQTMVDQAPQYKQEFREYLEHEQWTDLFKSVHKLKPNVTLMGFTHITGMLHELNEDLRVQRNLGTVPDRMTQLMTGLDKAIDELKAYLSLTP